MLLLIYPNMNHVDVSTVLFLAVPKPRIKHPLVQLQNVVCVLHRNSTVARRVTNVTSEHYGSP